MEPRYEHLMNSLERSGYLKTSEIASAMRAVDRVGFIPKEQEALAYEDKPILIGWDQVSPQPLIVSFMLELLSPRKGDKILDIGTGSGWQAAILSRIVGDSGKVVTVERVPELYALARENISRADLAAPGVIEFILGDASSDIGSDKVFDRIISGAETEDIPTLWKNLLAVGGRIVVPVGGSIVVADKIAADRFESREYIGFGFTPLIVGKKNNQK